MSALASFQAALPTWRPAVEAWLDSLPAPVRSDPPRAALAYLFASPPLQALGADLHADVEAGWVDWDGLEHRATQAGDVERALIHATRCLAAGDPGPALGLMLIFPSIDAFHWAHAAATVHSIVSDRQYRHAFAVR
jgi:hypothetical protein